jgi:methyl-accepting chemotaxis protein
MKVGIVGAGKAGSVFLESLLEISEIDIVGICDRNSNAPGLKLARENNINTFSDLKSFFKNDMDIVLELTGNEAVRKAIMTLKQEDTHVVDSNAAKMVSLLSEHQRSLNKKLKDYISHIDIFLKNLVKNIEDINETVKFTDETSKKIIESVSNSMDSINKTDKIIKIINDITSRIQILGINASIEAARAGEYGRGFSVVAEEIGKLTSSSKNATSDITEIIQNMKEDINNLSEISQILDTVCKKQTDIASSLTENNQKMEKIIIE